MEKIEKDIKGRKFTVRELLATEVDGIDFGNNETDPVIKEQKKKEALKRQLIISTGMTEKEYEELTWNERRILVEEVNNINGISVDFQKPSKEEKTT